jgi:hypothetical protein
LLSLNVRENFKPISLGKGRISNMYSYLYTRLPGGLGLVSHLRL